MFRKNNTKFIKRLSAGESTAWVQLITRCSPYLYSYVIYNVGNEAVARRLIRAILSEVIHTLASLRRVTNLTVLIFSIAYRHVLHYRRHIVDPLPSMQWPFASTSAAGDEHSANFFHTFYQFTPEVQQVLLLYYVCGVSVTELSQIVGQSETLLRKVLYRAKLYLN